MGGTFYSPPHRAMQFRGGRNVNFITVYEGRTTVHGIGKKQQSSTPRSFLQHRGGDWRKKTRGQQGKGVFTRIRLGEDWPLSNCVTHTLRGGGWGKGGIDVGYGRDTTYNKREGGNERCQALSFSEKRRQSPGGKLAYHPRGVKSSTGGSGRVQLRKGFGWQRGGFGLQN